MYKGGEVIEVASVIKHPKFNRNSLDYDFALMKLSKSIGLDGVTKAPIKLPSATTVIKDDSPVLVSGWGLTKNDSQNNEELRGVIVTIHNQAKCNNAYRLDGGVTARMVIKLIKFNAYFILLSAFYKGMCRLTWKGLVQCEFNEMVKKIFMSDIQIVKIF